MDQPLVVTTRLVDREPHGLRVLTVSGSNLSAITCSRKRFVSARQEPEFQQAGVYILRGPSEKAALSEKLYIGESDVLAERITHHHGKQGKDFWTDVVAFSTGDGSVNEAHAKGAESRLVKLAKIAGRVELENKNDPKPSQLSDYDEPRARKFFEEISFAALLLGINAFDVVEFDVSNEESTKIDQGGSPVLHLSSSGAEAKGIETDDGFVVFEGSIASSDPTTSFPDHHYFQLRQSLLQEGILIDDGQGVITLVRDYEFNSSSAAAAVMCAASKSGPDTWKDASGKTLKELYEEQSG